MKQILLLAFASLFLLSTCLYLEILVSAQILNDPYELVVATVGEPETVDPAWAYDKPSQELIFNVYETLIFYDRESVDRFVPMLATDWHISKDGLDYTFKIRQSVKFHNGEVLTPEDVEYSFERLMVQDRFGGPTWMIYEPLLGCWKADLGDPNFGEKIDNAIQYNASHVWFNLVEAYAPFLQILAQPWASILSRDWCAEQGDWNPATDPLDMSTGNWTKHHDPEVSALDYPTNVMMGTGPFRFDYWIKGVKWSVVKFDYYWRGWPAHGCRGYITRATVKTVPEWETRRDSFLRGDYDTVNVPMLDIPQIWGQPGIRCVYPLPMLIVEDMFFTLDIPTTDALGYPNPYLGDPPHDTGAIHETGIPHDFFADVDVRKGFAYSFNYTRYIENVYLGEAVQPATPVIEGLPYRNPMQEKYHIDLARAEECFRAAWGGQAWEKGFTMTLAYNTGSEPRQTAWEMIKTNVESLNPKFHIEVKSVPWDSWVQHLFQDLLPMYIMGFRIDLPDPHDLVYTFMYTHTCTPWFQPDDRRVNDLIEEGLRTTNTTRRREIYYELQQIYYDQCKSVPMAQRTERHWQRDWIQGWYYNPAFPGLYFYHLWKEELPPEDLNMDGTVNILDVAVAAQAFGSYCALPDVHPRWDSRADFNQDQNINIQDIAAVASKFGSQTPPWQPP